MFVKPISVYFITNSRGCPQEFTKAETFFFELSNSTVLSGKDRISQKNFTFFPTGMPGIFSVPFLDQRLPGASC